MPAGAHGAELVDGVAIDAPFVGDETDVGREEGDGDRDDEEGGGKVTEDAQMRASSARGRPATIRWAKLMVS